MIECFFFSGQEGSVQKAGDNRTPIRITEADLPLCCPKDAQSEWKSHPRVYLSIRRGGYSQCYYCGTEYHWPSSE